MFEIIFTIAEIAKFSSAEVQDYEESLMVFRDLKNTLDTAREEGKFEGLIEGEKKGEIKGKVAEKEEITRKLINRCMTDQEIQEITGLTLARIQEIRKKIKR